MVIALLQQCNFAT